MEPLVAALQDSTFKLTDLLGSAGATIGVIIAGTIFLQFTSSKYQDIATRYRGLTDEYRRGEKSESRHGSLQTQIKLYRWRLTLLIRASWIAALAVLSLLGSVFAGGMSIILPEVTSIRWIGSMLLLCGLGLIGIGIVFQLVEAFYARAEIGEEIGDLDEPVKVR